MKSLKNNDPSLEGHPNIAYHFPMFQKNQTIDLKEITETKCDMYKLCAMHTKYGQANPINLAGTASQLQQQPFY